MLDQDAAQLIARQLRSLCKPDEITAAIAKYYEPSWPTEYVNTETGRVYKPHQEAEAQVVFSDSPVNVLIKGGEGCIGAETLINGVPVADLTEDPGYHQVLTLVGTIPVRRAYLKGRADLYRVEAQSGAEVVVTAEHRLLTPTGFRPLSSLHVGDVIAADGTYCEHGKTRRASGSRDRYSLGSHQYDELPSPLELVVLDKLRQLRSIVFGNSALFSPFLSHSCRKHYPALSELTLSANASLHPASSGACGLPRRSHYRLPQSSRRIHRPCIAGLLPPLAGHNSKDVPSSEQSLASSISEIHRCVMSLLCLLLFEYYDVHARVSQSHHDQISSEESLGLSDNLSDTVSEMYSPSKFQGAAPFPPASRFREISPQSCLGQFFPLTCPNYNTFWTEIQGVSYSKHSEFYDIHVPIWNHYSAQGLIHHNSGKSVAGIIKTLERLRRSMSGIMLSPDLPHFKRSLWSEFSRWCPWDQVVPEHRYRSKFSWEPRAPFALAFRNGTTLLCGGIDDPGAWEGPNVSFIHFDEPRRKKTPDALKVLTGRSRIPGPKGEPPQFYLTTTPRKNWLYEYYGPLKCRCESCGKRFEHYANTQAGHNYLNLCPSALPICTHCSSRNYHTDDEHAEFKLKALVVTLLTLENEPNLQEGFADDRALTLTSAEARVLLEAEWEDTDTPERFLPNMLLWDKLREDLPALTSHDPLVVALDAATGRTTSASDCFGIVGVTRHPDAARHRDGVAVRYVQKWQARPGRSIDFQGTESNPGPERVLRTLAKKYNVVMAPYDPSQLHDMATRLLRERIAWMFPFPQQSLRIKADTDLLYLITHSKIAHDGNKDLRDHVDNADRKVDSMGKKLRIVKREESLKVDLCVCLSMSAFQCLRLNLG